MERLLLIEDDREMCELLREYLESEDFELEAVQNGEEGLEKALKEAFSLVILDVMLPGLNGLEVLKEIQKVSDLPVLMLTAKGDDVDRIVGLELGADDYLAKPFNPRELLARIRAVLRRKVRTDAEGSAPLVVADVELDAASRVVHVGGNRINLTTVEFAILEILLQAAGRLVRRETLVMGALKRTYSPFDRSVDVHISNLRKKLGPYPNGRERITTLRGEGYQFALPGRGDR